MGRFLTPDPLGNAKLQDPGSWNQYSYAGGDPINHVDPSGNYWCTVGSGEHQETVWCEDFSVYIYGNQNAYQGMFNCYFFQQGCPSGVPAQTQGGGSGATNITNYSTTNAQAIAVQNSLRTLQAALQQDPTCSQWLTGNQGLIDTLVGNTSSGLLYVGVGNFSSTGNWITNAVSGTGGTNLPPGALLTVNLSGAFFSSSVNTGYMGNIGGGTDLAKAFILLHELGHLTDAAGFQPNDSGSTQGGIANQNSNNLLVQQNCAKTLDLFGGKF